MKSNLVFCANQFGDEDDLEENPQDAIVKKERGSPSTLKRCAADVKTPPAKKARLSTAGSLSDFGSELSSAPSSPAKPVKVSTLLWDLGLHST